MENLEVFDHEGNTINVEVVGFFKVPGLDKEYIIYSLMDSDPNNEMGAAMIGEVIRNGEIMQILGILEEEYELVMAVYNEIVDSCGGK